MALASFHLRVGDQTLHDLHFTFTKRSTAKATNWISPPPQRWLQLHEKGRRTKEVKTFLGRDKITRQYTVQTTIDGIAHNRLILRNQRSNAVPLCEYWISSDRWPRRANLTPRRLILSLYISKCISPKYIYADDNEDRWWLGYWHHCLPLLRSNSMLASIHCTCHKLSTSICLRRRPRKH